MSNLTQNRLNSILVAADITAINTSITTITSKLPTASLTDDQRSRLNAIDVDNKAFVEDAINEINSNGAGIIPPFIDPVLIQNDLTLFSQLDAIESNVENLLQKISDLKRIAGDEAYGMSLAAYRIFDAANTSGIPGAKQAYDKLKLRFDSQSSGAGRKPDAPLT
jgi:hypothetical protein